MKSYVKVYLDFFNYCIDDAIPCEVCGNKAVDISHIESKGRRPDLKDKIENLQALCRGCHIKFGDLKQHKQFLVDLHQKKLNGFSQSSTNRQQPNADS